MKRLTISLLALLCAAPAAAQQPVDTLPRWLQEQLPSRVEVVEHGDAGQVVAALREASQQARVRGWRVRIFFDNSQNARGQAGRALAQFREMFPEVASYMSYENPYFEVSVGNCLSIEEAVMLRARILSAFPKAFITSEAIPLAVLVQ